MVPAPRRGDAVAGGEFDWRLNLDWLQSMTSVAMGSVIDGEDARAFVALDELQEDPPLRAWLCSGSPTTARWTCCAAARLVADPGPADHLQRHDRLEADPEASEETLRLLFERIGRPVKSA